MAPLCAAESKAAGRHYMRHPEHIHPTHPGSLAGLILWMMTDAPKAASILTMQ